MHGHDFAPRLRRRRRRTVRHAARLSRPRPSQRSHGLVNTMCPRAQRRAPWPSQARARRRATAARVRRRRSLGTAPDATTDSGTLDPRARHASNESRQRSPRDRRRASGSSPRARHPGRHPRTTPRTSPPGAPSAGARSRSPSNAIVRRQDRLADSAPLVILAAPLDVGQDVVRLLDLPEHSRRRVVAGIDARMIAPREPPIRPLDLRLGHVRARARKIHGADCRVQVGGSGRNCPADTVESVARNPDVYFFSSTTSASMTSSVGPLPLAGRATERPAARPGPPAAPAFL